MLASFELSEILKGLDWWSILSKAADIVGVVAAVVTVITYVKVSSVQSAILRVKRLPELRRTLNKKAGQLLGLQNQLLQSSSATPGQINEIAALLAILVVDVKNIKEKLPSEHRGVAEEVLAKVRLYSGSKAANKADELFQVYASVVGLAAHLDHIESDWKAGVKPS